jgi:hypothetical protein
MTMHLTDQPLATCFPTVAPGHVCGCSGVIDEYLLGSSLVGILNHALRAAATSGRSCSASRDR